MPRVVRERFDPPQPIPNQPDKLLYGGQEYKLMPRTSAQATDMKYATESSRMNQDMDLLSDWIKAGKGGEVKDRKVFAQAVKDCGYEKQGDKIIIKGDLDVMGLSQLRSLPDNIIVDGCLKVIRCPNLRSVGEHLQTYGSAYITNCQKLKELPSTMKVGTSLTVTKCDSLDVIPSGLRVGASLDLSYLISLTSLPKGVYIGQDLSILQCPAFSNLPEQLTIPRDLHLLGCNGITQLPPGIKVGRNFSMKDSQSIKRLPLDIEVGRDIDMQNARAFEGFSLASLRVKGELNIEGCIKLTDLPAALEVDEDFLASSCELLAVLPNQFKVGGNLDLSDCVLIPALPETAEVGGHVDLTGCSQLRQLPEWLLGIGGVPGHFGLLRIISLAGTGVSPDVLHQLDMLEQHDVHFDIGHDLPSSKAKGIECRYGSEAEHILNVLRDNPHKDVFIKYAGSAGIDQGGLSRQAFYKAYEQLLKKPLFRRTAEQNLMFILNADKGQEQAYQDFAMILARISKLNMGVGQDLPHEFFVQLNIGLHEIKNFNKDESLMGQLAALDNKALFKLLDIFAPETLNTQDKKDYFKKLSLTDARQYIYDLSLAPLALAAGFLKAGGKAEAIDRTRERICGPADLKKKAIEALEVHVSRTHIDDYTFAKTLKADITKLLKHASDQELKAFCLEVTGAPSLCGKKPRLAIYTYDDVQAKDVMTRAHSCSRTMDINLASLALAQKSGYTKALKTALFSGTAMFSDA
ncbi:MAG: hypothetical protein VX185_08420 [Pseudomonadota bacterium]|nr:hypothetical protein [Pseudomonadota bacterium]